MRIPSFGAADLIGGVSIAGLLLPEAVAYAGIAGLAPQAGIIGLFAGLVCYGLVGRSRFAIVSPTSSSAAVVGAATLSIAGGDAVLRSAFAAALVLATGVAFLIAAAARLGAISNFISKPVLRGFSFGLALVIVVKQLPPLAGIHTQASFLPALFVEVIDARPRWNGAGIAIGIGALILLKAFARLRRVPGALLVIALGIACSTWARDRMSGVALVGPFSLALATPALPVLTRSEWLNVSELGLALLLLLFAESYGAIRGMAIRHGDAAAPNRDLAALGVANLLSGLLRGMPVGAGYSATSANEAAGAQSQLASWTAAAVVALLLAIFLPLIALTPAPVLAAIVIHAVSHTLTIDAFRPYFAWKRDRVVVVVSVLAVVLLGVLDGLLAGIGISLVMMLRGFSSPRVSELGRADAGHDFMSLVAHPNASRIPGLLVLRPEAPLFFANVERVLADIRARIAAAAPDGIARGVVISLEETPDLDGTSVESLATLVAELSARRIGLVLARLKDPVEALLRSALGEDHAARLQSGSVDDAAATLCAAPAAARRP